MSATTLGSEQRRLGVKLAYAGLYGDIENMLASRIMTMRNCSVVIEMWAVKEDVKYILHEIYPHKISAPCDNFPFKLSNSCRDGGFKRHNFSFQMIGTKKNTNAAKTQWLAKNKKITLRHVLYNFHKLIILDGGSLNHYMYLPMIN